MEELYNAGLLRHKCLAMTKCATAFALGMTVRSYRIIKVKQFSKSQVILLFVKANK